MSQLLEPGQVRDECVSILRKRFQRGRAAVILVDMFVRPRSLILAPGATYHVGTRGVRRSPIVYDDLDRTLFFTDFAAIVRDLGWRCHAYCLMTNHYHLLVKTPEPDLSIGMHRLNMRHAVRINRRHGFVGHVFEARFFAELVEDGPHFVALARYIDQNPVRAGLCAAPEHWPWSGCAAALGLRPRPSFFDPGDVLAYYAEDEARARIAYALSLQDYRRPGPSGPGPTPGGGTRPV